MGVSSVTFSCSFQSCWPWGQSDVTIGHEQFLGHWENLGKFPVLTWHAAEIVFRLDPEEKRSWWLLFS